MIIEFRQPENAKEVEKKPERITIDFSHYKKLRFSKSIDSCQLTGVMHSRHLVHEFNIMSSEIVSLTSRNVTWSRSDIKDCFIRKSSFLKVNLNNSAWINNLVRRSFSQCSLERTGESRWGCCSKGSETMGGVNARDAMASGGNLTIATAAATLNLVFERSAGGSRKVVQSTLSEDRSSLGRLP